MVDESTLTMAISKQSSIVSPSSTPKDEGGPTASEKSVYKPLSQDRDCTRFVRIRPAENDDEIIACELTEIAFGESPSFEALSYMWGDESVKETIMVNNIKFSVGKNLWDALRYLRRRWSGTLFWIDALCINQDDVPERNRQLRMMWHIYFRATTVVVWLGQKYATYQKKLSELRAHPEVSQSSETSGKSSGSDGEVGTPQISKKAAIERQMVKELTADEYWTRLWIVQEVGRARKRKVCFGETAMAWNSFTTLITLHSSDDNGPLRLAREIEQKYEGAHTLRKLLQSHRNARCKEPRDKIYGLIGLAVDARGFPMDYNKSLFEVWTDTMVFINGQGMFRETQREADIIACGNLIKYLLMGTQSTPLQQIVRPYEGQDDSTMIVEGTQAGNDSRVFGLRGTAIGQVISVGPTTSEIVTSLEAADKWDSLLQKNFGQGIGDARRQSDSLLDHILTMKKKQLDGLCFSHVSSVKWKLSRDAFESAVNCYVDDHHESGIKASNALSPPSHDTSETGKPLDEDVCLCQIASAYRGGLPWKMGLTSSQARVGDLIFWVQGTPKAILVRVIENKPSTRFDHGRQMLQICGTGLLMQDVVGETLSYEERVRDFSREDRCTLRMDARTIFVLLPPYNGEG